jgi:hypothetical protein
MTHLAVFSRVTWGAALAVVFASACGGNSFSGGDDPKGGEGSGGSVTTGGTGNVAGKGSGGSSSKAGTTSHAGTTSSAGAGGNQGGDACNAYPDSGNCEAYLERWYHDPATGLCRGFVYGGCGGNGNNYESFEACQKACPGGSPNYDACTKPTDCVVAGGGCCGICDAPDLKARDLIAYNKQYAANLFLCGGTAGAAAPPGDIACVPCLEPPADSGSLKYFVPNCVQGACVVEDIRTSSVSLCKTGQDCTLRSGNGCCESCGGSQAIAVNNTGAFQKLVCGDMLPPCAACEPAASGAIAYCNAMTQHCEVTYALDAPLGAK